MERIAPQQEIYGSSSNQHLTNGLNEASYGPHNYAVPAVTEYEGLFTRAMDTPPQLPINTLARILDSTLDAFRQGGSTYRHMAELVENMESFYWDNKNDKHLFLEAKQLIASHPLLAVILEDPFTRHSRLRPRGYPGDAELLDFIYRHDSIAGKLAATTERGRHIAVHNSDSPAPEGVRARGNFVASRISELVSRRKNVRIMSVACGHARELELLSDETVGSIKEFVAVDQDPRSLDVTRQHKDRIPSLVTHQATIAELMKDRDLAGFDFIYASGLYDYLSDRLAAKLTEHLFDGLKPNGRLLLANFLPNIRDIGYMEFFLDWQLIYRNEDQIRDFASRLDASDIDRLTYFVEPNHNIGFLEIMKR